MVWQPCGDGSMNYFSFLTSDEVRYVHDASLEILEEVGLLVRSEKARERFAQHGARVDHATEIVRIPGWTVGRPTKSTSDCRPLVPHRDSSRGGAGQGDRRVLDPKPMFEVGAVSGSIFTSASSLAASTFLSLNCGKPLDPTPVSGR